MIESVMAGLGLRYPPGALKASPIENRPLPDAAFWLLYVRERPRGLPKDGKEVMRLYRLAAGGSNWEKKALARLDGGKLRDVGSSVAAVTIIAPARL